MSAAAKSKRGARGPVVELALALVEALSFSDEFGARAVVSA